MGFCQIFLIYSPQRYLKFHLFLTHFNAGELTQYGIVFDVEKERDGRQKQNQSYLEEGWLTLVNVQGRSDLKMLTHTN